MTEMTAPAQPADDGVTRLYLVRHGETTWSRSGRHTSVTDLDLTEAGVAAAQSLRDRVAEVAFDRVLVSPRLRARRTAELLGVRADPEVEPDLVEWDYGDYEGLTTPQIRETVPDWTVFDGPVPGGETLEQVSERADRVVARVRAAGGTTLAVAHGHLLRILGARWLGLPADSGRHFELDPATLSRLGYERVVPTFEYWNSANG